jgi:hypothetical protein
MNKKDKSSERLYGLLAELADTVEIRNIISGIARAWLAKENGTGIFRRLAGRPSGWAVERIVNSDKNLGRLNSFFENSENIETIISELPAIAGVVRELIHKTVISFEKLPVERKKDLLDSIFTNWNSGSGKSLVTRFACIFEEISRDDPLFFSSRLVPVLERFISETDFGDIRSFFEATSEDFEAIVKGLADTFFEYPAKLLVAVSILPGIINSVSKSTDVILNHLNNLPVDIFADLLLTMLEEIDAGTVGKIFLRVNEVIRQAQTGSTLIGEVDAPKFTVNIKDKISDFLDEIDPALTIKARNALIDGRETVISSIIDALEERPEHLNLWLGQLAAKRNSEIRLFKRKIQVIESLPEEEATAALSAGLSSWNAYDLADAVNTICRMMNRMHVINPGIIKGLVTEFVNTIDRYELEDTLDWAVKDIGTAIRPVFRASAPFIIRELIGFFEEGEFDDGYDEAMAKAKEDLGRFLGLKGEKSLE